MGRHQRKLDKIKAKDELKAIKVGKAKQRQEAWENASPGTKQAAYIIVGIIGAIIFGLIVSSVVSSKKDAPAKPEAAKKTTYQAEVLGYNPLDPATLKVSVKITNTGQTEGKPDCSIHVSNPSGTYKGWDVFELDRSIAPGKEDYMNAQLTITKEGSAFVDKVDASCT